nr:hypothetical protein GCM10020093_028510 [Planobispora longispora]
MGLNEKPLSTLHEKASYELADFAVPTGREEEWRFTRCRGSRACTTAPPPPPAR